MNIQELNELIQKNTNKITSVNGYKSILNRGNNLIRFDVLNRILIYLQCENAFDIRTVEEWELIGRKVISESSPIFIIVPKYKSSYIESDTGNILETHDLSMEEMLKAIEYKIVYREDTLETMYSVPLYDIRSTVNKVESEYIINKPKLSSSNILNLLSDVTGAMIELCDEDYYSKSENTIFISKKPYRELSLTVSKFITKYIMDYKLSEIVVNTSYKDIKSIPKQELNLIENSILFSICTLLAAEIDIDFSILHHITYDNILTILNIVDTAMYNVINHIQFEGNDISLDAIPNILKLHKAEIILDVMEANNINKIMKGN